MLVGVVKDLIFDLNGCLDGSFREVAQLEDTEYVMQVVKECYAFGIHTPDYLEYQSSNGGSLYLRKHPVNKTVTNEIEASRRDRMDKRDYLSFNFWLNLPIILPSLTMVMNL